ncbi:MAG: UDP-N-acetylmuramoyl-tripeptide--D-alanyl-D-alanine ligase [Lachnospiraceae bacterium]|nr:UDP-N-acetylmuramoyl-tripeptide--D-alanyl-D-alanine ligase [Lachnospiraceae bacterium]
MRGMTLQKIAQACGGKLIPAGCLNEETEASCVVIDSRKIEENGIFVATKGERADGHSFIGQVFEKGALGVICERIPKENEKAGNFILVKDSLQALKDLARYYKSLFSTPTIGIIGSMGKTSTKEMVAAVLSERYRVLKTEGNFNNEIGVPLTVLRLRDEHEIAVIEMGISTFGEMSRLAEIVRPDSVVFTNIGPCHLEVLQDLDGVYRAKTEVFSYLSGKGRVCLNGDDEKLRATGEVMGKPPLFYGLSPQNDISAKDVVNRELEGTDAVISLEGSEFSVHIPLPGRHTIYNALAAAAAGLCYGLSGEEIQQGIEHVQGLPGRMNPIRTGKYLVVDDCYNANPRSMESALSLLGGTKSGNRTIAILGDMYELGEDSDLLHRELGRYAAGLAVDQLVIAGELSKSMYEAAAEACKEKADGPAISYYADTDALLESLKAENPFQEGDVILVKASHGMHFEKVVALLTEIMIQD